jgi:predicted RNase H-like nuclease
MQSVGYDVGVDLAWGQVGRTGLAVLDSEGLLLDVSLAVSDAEVLDWLRRWTGGPCLVAVDAPVIVSNPAGTMRRAERLVGRYYGRFGASCHASNTANAHFADGGRAQRIIEQLGLTVDPRSAAPRRAIEVYPHPALVVFFDLPGVLQYKSKPGRSLERRRAETARLLAYLDSLANHEVALHVTARPAWQAIAHAVQAAATGAALRAVEDQIDAVVCAYIARYTRLRPTAVRVLGDVQDGYIVVPVTPALATVIDADQPSPVHQPVAGPFLVLDVIGRPASYSSAAEAPWTAAVRAAATTGGQPVRDTRFGVRMEFRTPVATNPNEVWDLDNLVKPTLDAMEGVFGLRRWAGPAQAADDRVDILHASKRTVTPDEPAGARIEVYDLTQDRPSPPTGMTGLHEPLPT